MMTKSYILQRREKTTIRTAADFFQRVRYQSLYGKRKLEVTSQTIRVVTHLIKGGVYLSLIIDRFEGDFAVVEVDGKEMKDISKKDIPQFAKEGDVLKQLNGKYELDVEETQRIRAEAEKMMKDMWK